MVSLIILLGALWGVAMLRIRGIKRRNILLEQKVKERTFELEQAHERIVKLEKESIEKRMAGGFAHEIRNALAGAKLLVLRVLRADSERESESINQKNSK